MEESFMRKNLCSIACCLACSLLILSCSSLKNESPGVGATKGVALGDLSVDRCLFYSEGENYKDKSGGDMDYKDGAYGKKCLGMRWGEKPTDFVDYEVFLESPIESAILVVRAAIDNPKPLQYEIILDNKTIQSAEFAPTGGYGYTEKEWRCNTVSLGRVEKGRHILKLRPSKNGGIVNIDSLALGKA
jgi:hypothetical protein